MPKTLAPPVGPGQETESFDIEQTSKACGLSAGVLRMWELRYGWPRPGRLPNGYRYFTRYQIEDLKRMAALVKSGMLISRLIQDGMPKWPNDGSSPKNAGPVLLEATNALPKPRHITAQQIRDKLIEALKTQNHGRTWEMLLRCTWEVHPSEQALTAWMPCLVAFEEFKVKDKPFARQESLQKFIKDHVKDVLGRFAPEERPLWVIPATEADQSLAYVTSQVLSQVGHAARPWLWDQLPKGSARFVTVGNKATVDAARASGRYPTEQHVAHFNVLESKDCHSVISLVQDNPNLSYLTPA
jgi:DNA-binding transcriptional MerR regulator